MSDKRRDLPSWMRDAEAMRRKQAEQRNNVEPRGKNKSRVQRETVYFMNEAELVDAAYRVLREGDGNRGTGIRAVQTETEKHVQDWLVKTNGNFIKRKKKPFESDTEGESSDCELSKKRYISETDAEDLAEKETVPYVALEPGGRDVVGVAERSAEELNLPSCSGAPELDHKSASSGASDDEALRLVREIFFT